MTQPLLAGAGADAVPATAVLHYPGGLADYLKATLGKRHTLTPAPFAGQGALNGDAGRVEWALAWPEDEEGFVASHCNTVPTAEGGSHEAGMRAALVRGLKAYGALVGNKRAAQLNADDVTGGACALLSVFLRDPQFQGQTKERLSSPEAGRLVENALGDHFDHWLSADPSAANLLLERIVERAEERLRRKKDREVARKRAARKTRLPGKLADCAREAAAGTEIFLVEGDSAGGSAKQARNRETQAVLPLRGKILNVASASADKLRGNKELDDLVQALGCGTAARFDAGALRYERVIIMTDADVDGAHIAALLMTFFYRQMPGLIDAGHLFLAQPPLYRLARVAAPPAMRATTPTASGCWPPTSPAPARSRPAASRGWARCRRPSSRKPPWTRRGARCCGSRSHTTRPRPRRTPGRGADGPPPRIPPRLHPVPRRHGDRAGPVTRQAARGVREGPGRNAAQSACPAPQGYE